MTISFTNGPVSVDLGDQLEQFVLGIVERTATAALVTARAICEEVAVSARRDWYGPIGVRRITGQSGDIQVREVVDIAAGTVTVSVGSADPRMAGRKPVPVYVRRPGRMSVVKVPVTRAKYFETAPSMRANFSKPLPGDPRGTRPPYVFVPNPAAQDGKFLLQELVKKPVRLALRRAAADLGRALSDV